MAIQSSFYLVDGSTRTFPSTKHIATKQHCAVYLKNAILLTWSVAPVASYSLINNGIVFDTAPSSTLYSEIEIRIVDTQGEIVDSPSNITIVATNIASINTDATNISSINTVATNIGAVNTTLGSIANINTVAANIVNVNLAGSNTSNINAVVANSSNVNTVAADLLEPISEINTVAQSIGAVENVGTWITAGFPTVLNSVNMMINTIATLRTTLYSGQQIVSVTGYYTAADNIGVREYYWDAVSVEADNGGTIIQVSGVVTGRWKMKYSGAVNVKWFGAKGDGVTDDAIYIQNAISMLDIYIPKGTYILSVGIETISNMTIRGDGSNITILRARDLCLENVNDAPVAGKYKGGLLKGTSVSNINISGICIDGNSIGQNSVVVCSNAMFSICNNVNFIECKSYDAKQEGFKFMGSTNCSVLNSITENNNYSGISLGLAQTHLLQATPDINSQCNYFRALNNISKNDGVASASAYSIGARYCEIINNTIINAGFYGISAGHASSGATDPAVDCSYSNFTNNIIDIPSYLGDTNGAGICLVYCTEGVNISKNIIKSSKGIGILKPQSSLSANTSNFIIDGNLISNSGSHGIAIYGAKKYSIIGNKISSAVDTAFSSGDYASIYISADTVSTTDHDSIISENTVIEAGTALITGSAVVHGIYVASARNIMVKNNVVKDNRDSGLIKMSKGFTALSNTSFIKVENNAFIADSRYISGNAITITLDATAKTITRSAGDFTVDGIVAGQSISAYGFVNPENNATYIIQSLTATVITYTSANTTPINETGGTSAVSLYVSKTSVLAPFITNDGAVPFCKNNILSYYPMNGLFYLKNGATSHILSNPNILPSLKTYIRTFPFNAGGAVRANGMYQGTFTSGSGTFTTSAAVTGDRFIYELL